MTTDRDTPQRWTIVSDEDGHQWLCPLERADEVQRQIYALYDDGDPVVSDPTEGLERIEGERLTFVDPRLE